RPTLPIKITPVPGHNEFVFEPPDGFTNRGRGHTAVDISLEVWKAYPRDRAIAQLIYNGGWFSSYGFSIEYSTPQRASYLSITLPTTWAALQAYFSRRGFQIRASAPADYANALLGLIGGLHAVSVLASVTAYRVLDALALKSSKKV